MGTASRFRVVVELTSALLCHTHFPTVDSLSRNTARHLSHCAFFQTVLQLEIGSIILETNWNELVLSNFIQQLLKMNSHSMTNFVLSRNHVTTITFHIEVLLFFASDPRNS